MGRVSPSINSFHNVLVAPQAEMVSVVVPTYNERETIGKFLERTTAILETIGIKSEIIVVDDNSPDGTAGIVEHFAREHESMTIVKRPGKSGLSAACVHGFSWSHPHSTILGVMDADLSHAPDALPYLINPIVYRLCDITVGSRYVYGGRVLNWPLYRYIGSRVACILGSSLASVKDVTSGFFFFRRNVIDGVKLDPVGFKICLEILVKANYQTVIEVPYTFLDRVSGKSKMGIKEMYQYLRHLARLYQYKRRMRAQR